MDTENQREIQVFELGFDHRHFSEFLYTNESDISKIQALYDGLTFAEVGLNTIRVDPADEGFRDGEPNDRPFGNLSYLASGFAVFDRTAVETLNEILREGGELLPLESIVGEYYLFNCTRFVDSLDRDRGEFKYFLDRKRIRQVVRWWFVPEKLKGVSVFRAVDSRGSLLVTDLFMRRIEDAKLSGFLCPRLWGSSDKVPTLRKLP